MELDPRGLAAARRYAGWEIGDQSWADLILEAYFDPEGTNERLDLDGVPDETGVYRRW